MEKFAHGPSNIRSMIVLADESTYDISTSYTYLAGAFNAFVWVLVKDNVTTPSVLGAGKAPVNAVVSAESEL